jgi:hypothetical protein
MVLRWTAAAVLEAVNGFRRLKRNNDLPTLVAELRARDQQLGAAGSPYDRVHSVVKALKKGVYV